MMGMEMMLKSMGVDIPALMQQLTEFTAAAKQIAERLSAIEKRLEKIEHGNNSTGNTAAD